MDRLLTDENVVILLTKNDCLSEFDFGEYTGCVAKIIADSISETVEVIRQEQDAKTAKLVAKEIFKELDRLKELHEDSDEFCIDCFNEDLNIIKSKYGESDE
jgi:hypothetical protein